MGTEMELPEGQVFADEEDSPTPSSAAELGEKYRELVERESEESAADETPTEEGGEDAGTRLRARKDEAREVEGDEPATPKPPDPVAEGWPVCPVCAGMGHVPPGLQESKREERCQDCGGHGVVLSGSLKEDAAILQCATCMGNGWTQKPPELPPEPVGERQDWERRY